MKLRIHQVTIAADNVHGSAAKHVPQQRATVWVILVSFMASTNGAIESSTS